MNWRRRKSDDPSPEPQAPPTPEPQPQAAAEPELPEFVVRHVHHADLLRMVGLQPPPPVPHGPLTQASTRKLEEREAQRADQPFEWASHAYLTVHGELRWRCCGNLFTDDHGPHCGMPEGLAL